MFRRLGKKAQTTAEYAILVALVVGAVVTMQVYIKRGLQGRIRDVVDHAGTSGEIAGSSFSFSGNQYEPYYTSSNVTTSQDTGETKTLQTGGAFATTSNANVTANRTQQTGW
jgi:Flp pilus assembly pilin Flp